MGGDDAALDTAMVAIAKLEAELAELKTKLSSDRLDETGNPLSAQKEDDADDASDSSVQLDDTAAGTTVVTKAQVASTVREVAAELKETPANYHQFVIFALSRPADSTDEIDVELRRWGPALFLGAVLIVTMQLGTVIAILTGVIWKSCVTSDTCVLKGTYCSVGAGDRCQHCGFAVPLPMETNPTTGETFNAPFDSNFAGFNSTAIRELCAHPADITAYDALGHPIDFAESSLVSWCDACYFPATGHVDPATRYDHYAASVAAAGGFDWLTLYFAFSVIALNIVGELRDISLGAIAAEHAGDHLTKAWRTALSLVSGTRRWTFLPNIAHAAINLVCVDGAGAKSVCLNTVSILFMLEADNMVSRRPACIINIP
jgi:hypothetical protein